MEITDVTTIDQLSDAEFDELLERSLNPRTPIELFYAVLDRIGGVVAAAPEPAPVLAPEYQAERVPVEAGSEV